MVCITQNMDQRKSCLKKIIGKGYKTIIKQLDVPVTTTANIIKTFKVPGTVATRKIDPGLNRTDSVDGRQRAKDNFQKDAV